MRDWIVLSGIGVAHNTLAGGDGGLWPSSTEADWAVLTSRIGKDDTEGLKFRPASLFLSDGAPVGVFLPSAPQLPRYGTGRSTFRDGGSILVVQLYNQYVKP